MKRGTIEITFEMLKERIKELPEDLKISGIEYNFETNIMEIYGYSDSFKDITEGAHGHYNKLMFKNGFWEGD